jgi:hypothetical protein
MILAAAVILLVNSIGWTANAATSTGAHSECDEKLLADQGNGMPRLRPLVRTGLCESVRSLPVPVPALFLSF